jgi:uncharacterized membrane protein (DUF4010 family)
VIVSSILGGAVSSTSVTTALAHQSRSSPDSKALGAGAVAACTIMAVRVAVACAVINPAMALELPRYLVPSILIGVTVVVAARRREDGPGDLRLPTESPLQLAAALKMTALFQLVLFAILWVRARWSADALVATSVFIGLTDVDALTLSLARSWTGTAGLGMAAHALAAGVLANTLLKLGIAAVLGRGSFRTVTVLTLAGMAAAMLAAMLL